jgi:alpha-1,6-mannosyltransferase
VSDPPSQPPRVLAAPPPRVAPILVLGVVTLALYASNAWLGRALFRDAIAPASGMALYAVVNLALFLIYGRVLRLCARGELAGPAARACALTVPCLVNILLVATVPSLSEDIFSYLAHGMLGLTPGDNPLLQPAEQAAHTPIGAALARAGWHGQIGISPYGIVWTQIEIAAMKLGGQLPAALLVLKSLIAALSLASAYCIWLFLGRTRPAVQLYGTLAYLWNPLLLVELAGEGHNDALMIFLVTAALAACARNRPTASLLAQALAVATKYVPLLFLPAQLVYLWRQRRSTARLARDVLAALALTLLILTALYAPLWAGAHSFDGLLRRAAPISSASPFGAINWLLRRSPWAAAAAPLTLGVVTLPLLGLIAWCSLKVHDATALARAFAWIALGYTLFAAPDYWPWYACLPVALVIAADMKNLLWLVILMSLTARLCAPLELLRDHRYLTMIAAKGALTGLGATVPLAALAVWLVLQRWAVASRSAHA